MLWLPSQNVVRNFDRYSRHYFWQEYGEYRQGDRHESFPVPVRASFLERCALPGRLRLPERLDGNDEVAPHQQGSARSGRCERQRDPALPLPHLHRDIRGGSPGAGDRIKPARVSGDLPRPHGGRLPQGTQALREDDLA